MIEVAHAVQVVEGVIEKTRLSLDLRQKNLPEHGRGDHVGEIVLDGVELSGRPEREPAGGPLGRRGEDRLTPSVNLDPDVHQVGFKGGHVLRAVDQVVEKRRAAPQGGQRIAGGAEGAEARNGAPGRLPGLEAEHFQVQLPPAVSLVQGKLPEVEIGQGAGRNDRVEPAGMIVQADRAAQEGGGAVPARIARVPAGKGLGPVKGPPVRVFVRGRQVIEGEKPGPAPRRRGRRCFFRNAFPQSGHPEAAAAEVFARPPGPVAFGGFRPVVLILEFHHGQPRESGTGSQAPSRLIDSWLTRPGRVMSIASWMPTGGGRRPRMLSRKSITSK
ncbi:MAG: hypothetical protein BWY73_01255 [candidate division TA06 bacterium ADurb.Bin417]|uniref:Uncharacterized protein n=1 Tax=candidate division TA06 bacterium ADurb.Bin417 TaxID=1852828 RepID=A0A1V5MBX5_UNCT6|nr:MAG: hypothetical protein BWY73_01255 [candidate division TA06 bacterium ADurb.Bin417]